MPWSLGRSACAGEGIENATRKRGKGKGLRNLQGLQFRKGKAMNYYLLVYHVVDDYVTRRVPFREEHLRLVREAHRRGELILAGALADPVDQAVLVFKSPDQTVIEEFVRKDPYVNNGLVKRREIRPWTVVVE